MNLNFFVPRTLRYGSYNRSLNLYLYNNKCVHQSQRSFHQGAVKLMAAPGVANRTVAAAFKKKPTTVATDKGKNITNNVAKMDNWNILQSSKIILPELNLENFTQENINTVFTIPSSLKKKFGTNLIPKRLNTDFSLAQEAGLLFRQCTFELNKYLEENMEKKIAPLILDGKSGLGKSALLFQIVSQKILTQDWLVVYIPTLKKYTNGSQGYSASSTPGVYIQPTATSEFLDTVLSLNETLLEKINLCENLKIGLTEYTKETSLAQIVLRGSQNPKFATTCLRVFFDTISKQTSVPVLLALDEVNSLYGTSGYYNQQSQKLASTDLLFVRILADFFEQKKSLSKGFVIGATSWIDRELVNSEFGNPNIRDYPTKVVSSKTESNLPIEKFWVPSYNLNEGKAITEFYKEAAIIPQIDLPQDVEQKLLMSGANPSRFFRLSTQLF